MRRMRQLSQVFVIVSFVAVSLFALAPLGFSWGEAGPEGSGAAPITGLVQVHCEAGEFQVCVIYDNAAGTGQPTYITDQVECKAFLDGLAQTHDSYTVVYDTSCSHHLD